MSRLSHHSLQRLSSSALLVMLAVPGCYMGMQAMPDGDDVGSSGTGVAEDDAGSEDTGVPLGCDPGDAPLRRLTHAQYDNTLRDLLGDNSAPAARFPTEEDVDGFVNQAESQSVTVPLAEHYLDAAEDVAARAMDRLDTLLPCELPVQDEAQCASEFITSFGLRAFRRPLRAEEHERLFAFFEDRAAMGGFTDGIRLLVTYFLQSPTFLYRPELSPAEPEDGSASLDDWEMASRLSYLLWNTQPDDDLLHAARDGQLTDPDRIFEHVERMLDDPRAAATVADFHDRWLQLRLVETMSRDPDLPGYDDGLRDDLRREAAAFVRHVVLDRDGTLEELLTSDLLMVNDRLAPFFGVPAPGTGEEFVPVSAPPGQASGLLTRPAWLAIRSHFDRSSPTRRGELIRSEFLCQNVPPPPPDVDDSPAEDHDAHASNPNCYGCHLLIDPIGLGLENYNAVGQWRDTIDGETIDAHGEIVAFDGPPMFDGPVELGQNLSQSTDVRACVSRKWFQYSYGHAAASADECTIDRMTTALDDGASIRDLLLEIATDPAFRHRPSR